MSETSVSYGSNLEALYAVEDSWGDLPSGPTVYNLRCTGFGINMTRDSFTSNELRSDRQTEDSREGMDQVSGDIPVELSYGAFDDLIASAMFNTWNSADEISIGTTQSSLRIARGFPAMNQFHEFSGCIVNSWSMSVQPNAIITSSFGFMGKSMTTYTTSGAMHHDYTAVDKATNAAFDSFSGALYIGTKETDPGSADEIAVVTGIDFSLENNITPLQTIGNQQAVGMSEGRATISGTVTAFFADSTLIDYFLDETPVAVEFTLTDDSSNSYRFYMPKVRFSGANLSVDGEGPVSMSLPFTALIAKGGSFLNTLKITKL